MSKPTFVTTTIYNIAIYNNDVLIHSAAQMQDCLINLLTYLLR